MSKPRYLIYDNLVQGAGMGHTARDYMRIHSWAIIHGYTLVTPLCDLGHGFGKSGLFEKALGIPNQKNLRKFLLDNPQTQNLHVPHPQGALPNGYVSPKTRKVFLNYYNNRVPLTEPPNQDIKNITISIRRGDAAMCPDTIVRRRLLPTSYFLQAVRRALDLFAIKDFKLTIFSDGGMGEHRGSYVDEFGNPESILDSFSPYTNSLNFAVGPPSPRTTLEQFHHSIQSDIFIASPSGFSKLISFYREGRVNIFPKRSNSLGTNNIYIDPHTGDVVQ